MYILNMYTNETNILKMTPANSQPFKKRQSSLEYMYMYVCMIVGTLDIFYKPINRGVYLCEEKSQAMTFSSETRQENKDRNGRSMHGKNLVSSIHKGMSCWILDWEFTMCQVCL